MIRKCEHTKKPATIDSTNDSFIQSKAFLRLEEGHLSELVDRQSGYKNINVYI